MTDSSSWAGITKRNRDLPVTAGSRGPTGPRGPGSRVEATVMTAMKSEQAGEGRPSMRPRPRLKRRIEEYRHWWFRREVRRFPVGLRGLLRYPADDFDREGQRRTGSRRAGRLGSGRSGGSGSAGRPGLGPSRRRNDEGPGDRSGHHAGDHQVSCCCAGMSIIARRHHQDSAQSGDLDRPRSGNRRPSSRSVTSARAAGKA